MADKFDKDERGVAIVIVVVLLGAILMLVAYFLNVSGLLVARTKLQAIAEFAAAGGGRVVAEEIAKRAGANVAAGVFLAPMAGEIKHPEIYLTNTDRDEIQNNLEIKNSVGNMARYYAEKNNNWDWADVTPSLQINYPAETNNCDGKKVGEQGRQNTVEVTVVAEHEEPLFMERLVSLAHGSPTIVLSASSFYSIPICP